VFVFFVLLTLLENFFRVLVAGGSALCVSYSDIENASPSMLPKSIDRHIPSVFVLKYIQSVGGIRTLILRSIYSTVLSCIRIASVAPSVCCIVLPIVIRILVPTCCINKRFVGDPRRLISLTSKMPKFQGHIIVPNMHQTTNLARHGMLN
jgi:hypothetical protein